MSHLDSDCCNPGVRCDVKNCVYHDGDKACTAEKINVGPTYAVSTTDTACATFKPQTK
ncbi:MAG: DUF1540 domain-containing protein [Clostridiales bacterium]|jgi:hypothetical protein|nr:DUF1540 domain-containing protein [Clostridiales bacterium]